MLRESSSESRRPFTQTCSYNRDCTMKGSISLTVIDFFPNWFVVSLQYFELWPPLDWRTNSSKESKTTILTTAASSADCNTPIPVPSLFFLTRDQSFVSYLHKLAISDCWKLGFCNDQGRGSFAIPTFYRNFPKHNLPWN